MPVKKVVTRERANQRKFYGMEGASWPFGGEGGHARGVLVVDPVSFGDAVVGNGRMRDLQVVDDSGNVGWVSCLFCGESNTAYRFIRTLRESLFGCVRHAVALMMTDGGLYRYNRAAQVAIKCMSKERIRENTARITEDPMKEIAALQFLSQPGHPNVQRMIECVQDTENIYSICPFYRGGEMFDYLENRGGGFPETQAKSFFIQILNGVEYLQQYRICHHDMSLENLLVDDASNCIVIDLGMCSRIPSIDGAGKILLRAQGQIGKVTYMAPEVFQDLDFDGFAIDIWACGVILFIMLTGTV